MKNTKILLGLTTTPRSDWREKIKEIVKFNISEIALFPTFLKAKERKEFYNLLEKTPVKKIPHVHLRDDMEEWEIEMLCEKYQSEVFNIHEEHSDVPVFQKYRNKIYIENAYRFIDENNLKKYAGICLDVTHLEKILSINKSIYNQIMDLVVKYPIGCCHISSKVNFLHSFFRTIKLCGSHYMINLKEIDYVKKYLPYFPKYASIELENPIAIQLKVKNKIEKMLSE